MRKEREKEQERKEERDKQNSFGQDKKLGAFFILQMIHHNLVEPTLMSQIMNRKKSFSKLFSLTRNMELDTFCENLCSKKYANLI